MLEEEFTAFGLLNSSFFFVVADLSALCVNIVRTHTYLNKLFGNSWFGVRKRQAYCPEMPDLQSGNT